MRRRPTRVSTPRSGFAGFRFPSEVITLAVRWYLRYGLSYRDVEELLAERGIAVDQVMPRSYTACSWVARSVTSGQDSGCGWAVGVGGAASGDLLPDLQGPG
jgi:hypothetical protein